MEVGHGQELGIAFGEPLLCGRTLALWAVPVATAVVGNGGVGTVLAARDMAAESRRAAVLDRRHHLELAEADMAGIGLTPCRSMAAEDIRDLQSRARHPRRALAGRPDLLELQCDMLQRAHQMLDRPGGHPRIERRRIELGVTEQNLDHADVDVLLQEMGGEAVPQRVERYALVDLGYLSCCMASAIELAHREMVDPVLSGKQPSLRPCCPPPGAQQFEQMRREHHVAVFVALALLHTDEHALAVDVADLERNHFGSPQARPIGHAQRRLVLEPRRRIEQPRYLLWTEHHRQLARLTDERRVLDDIVSLERDPEKEPQRRHSVIENRRLRAVLGKMQLKAPNLLRARRVG